jgi:hypothetical protein
MCPFSNEVAKNDGHDVIIIRPRKDIRARVVHQLVTKQHRQSGVIHRTNEVPYRTDVVDGTFLYVLRNIERGFDTVESSRSLFTYSPRHPKPVWLLYPRRRSGGLCYLVDLQTLPSASYIFLRRIIHALDGEKLTKNVTSLSSVKLSR